MGNVPLNRIVAFAGPYIAVLAGAVADWLFVHMNFLANFHTVGEVAGWVQQVVVWGLTSLLAWAGMNKWLSGWQRYESPLIAETMAAAPYDKPAPSLESPLPPSPSRVPAPPPPPPQPAPTRPAPPPPPTPAPTEPPPPPPPINPATKLPHKPPEEKP